MGDKRTVNTKESYSITQKNVPPVDREHPRTFSRLDGLPCYQNAASIHNTFDFNVGVSLSGHTRQVDYVLASDQEIHTDIFNKGHDSRNGHPPRGHTQFRQDSTLGQGDTRKTSVVDEVSGGPTSERIIEAAFDYLAFGQEDKRESIGMEKNSSEPIFQTPEGALGYGRNTGTRRKMKFSGYASNSYTDCRQECGTLDQGPSRGRGRMYVTPGGIISQRMEGGLGQRRKTIQDSDHPYSGHKTYKQDYQSDQGATADSCVNITSFRVRDVRVKGGQRRNTETTQKNKYNEYLCRSQYRQNSTLDQGDTRDSSVDVISGEPISLRKSGRVKGSQERYIGTLEQNQCYGGHRFASRQAQLGQTTRRDTRKDMQADVRLPSRSYATHDSSMDSALQKGVNRQIKETKLRSTMEILKDDRMKNVSCEDVLEKFIKHILEDKDKALVSHEKKCDEVMQSIESLQSDTNGAGRSKFIPFDQFEKRNAEKEALLQKARELNCQKKEFTEVVSKLIDRLLALKSVKIGWQELDSETKEVSQLMEREKERLIKALPIYAKRSVITNTVKDNQVSIILGETGSGKSTQVVQYLYDSGLAEEGVIVCTQPRKVAAFSLESYVRKEMKGSGDVVECVVGARAPNKRAKKTKILFTTDYSLLMECIKDQDLTRFSCVIIDEAHERNMNTDLLLGIIKKALPRRPDLRVIITSATINPDLFVKYFGDQCPVVRVSGKTFPVDVIWKKEKSSGDYVLEAVEKVLEIHENEEAGDVLVFLTCPAEIEQACTKVQNRIKKNDVIFLPLHGKLRQEEQKKVFKPTPKGKRKVVFSTNCAETSLTIPGIKFVVDTGKAKEMKYDPKRNMNSLEVSDVSQSSANQRKGRAGRIESGKCYRLYTEDDFEAMEKSSKPEILRVNLGQALLKLMELGIRNPADFDYVESPPIESIKTAMMELEELGATRDGQLIELGKKMAKVPVDPTLSRFLFEGFDQGVGYEALVLVSVATINGSVFFRMGTEEEKKAADMKKVEFCHLGGDFMTLLDVYRSWQKVDKRDRGRWCFDKSLNAKAMRMADETVKDLKSTLKHELKMPDIKWSSLDKETTDGRLQKALFSCFLTKLCVYTGHEKKGYKTITGGHFVKVHPSSSINFTGSSPQFIVYEKILKTSQDFLLNVTPIESSWLQESIAEKKLDLDIEEVMAEVLMVTPPISIPCSSILMKRALEPFRSKLPALEKNISDSCNNAPVVVEAKRNAGKVDLFVPKNYAEEAVELTQKILEEQRGRLREETREFPAIPESSTTRVVMGSGLTVQQILMPDMYRAVVVRNLQDTPLYSADVKAFLCQFGKLIDFNGYGNLYFATYEKPEEATEAVAFCTVDELGYKVEPKKKRQMSQQGRDSSQYNFNIKINWFRREPKGMANVFFQNQPEEMWYEISSIAELKVRGSNSPRVRRDKHKEKTLFLSNLSTNTTKQDIKEAVENFFNGCVTIRDGDILIQYKQRETLADTEGQKEALEKLISQYATPGSFQVTVKEMDQADFV